MIRKIAAAVVLIPLAVVIVSFAVANRQTVVVSFDPFDSAQPAYAASMPLFVLIFILVIFGIVLGGAVAWLGKMRWRWAARRAEHDIGELRRENDLLKRQLGGIGPTRLSPPLVPPVSPRAPVE
ncbi:MAG: LapA family protein [Xanthobacteraceae bacterium]